MGEVFVLGFDGGRLVEIRRRLFWIGRIVFRERSVDEGNGLVV